VPWRKPETVDGQAILKLEVLVEDVPLEHHDLRAAIMEATEDPTRCASTR
jgi:hypothetical protein